MVKLIFLFGLFLYALPSLAANLTLRLDSHTIEMGKFTFATITYTGATDPGPIDLSLWEENFFLQQSDADLEVIDNGQIKTQVSVRLYPRHTGKITLDSIALGGSFAKPQYITVKPSIRYSIDGTPVVRPYKNILWADEVFLIEVDVPRFLAKNVISAKEWEQKGFVITALQSREIHNGQLAITRLRWQLYSPIKGRHTLELPAIIQRGKGRFRYHLPVISIRIKPIPLYIPSSVVIGKPKLTSKIKYNTSGNKILELSFRKPGYLPEHIEGLQRAIDTIDPLYIKHYQTDFNGINTQRYNLTLPDNLWGKQVNLTLSYFDTKTGLIKQQTFNLPELWTLSKVSQWSLIAVILLCVLFALRWLQNKADLLRQKYKFRQAIKLSKTPHELRTILIRINKYKTLQNWAKHSKNPSATQIAKQLNQLCFSSQPTPDSSTQTTLQSIQQKLLA